jgi:hypothetical protein
MCEYNFAGFRRDSCRSAEQCNLHATGISDSLKNGSCLQKNLHGF